MGANTEIMTNEIKLITVYIFFWSFWLLYSYIAGYPIELFTAFVVFVSFSGFLIGLFFSNQKNKKEIIVPLALGKIKRYLNFMVLINGVLLIGVLHSIYKNGFEHRDLMFTDEGLFGNIFITYLINYFIQPLTLVAVVISISIKDENINYQYYAYTMLGMMSVVSLGRFPIYYMIYFYMVNQLLCNNKSREIGSLAKTIIVLSLIFYISWFILSKKLVDTGSDVDNIIDIIRIYVLNYHIIGYHMLDNLVSLNYPENIDFVYPTTSLGFLGWFAHLLTKYSGFLPVFPNSYMDLMEIYNGGFYLDKLQWAYNAFTTSILPLYADGGVFGVFIGFFVYGIIAARGSNFNCYKISPVFILVIFMLTFSLFQPFINSSFPLCLFYLWIFNKFLVRKTSFLFGTK